MKHYKFRKSVDPVEFSKSGPTTSQFFKWFINHFYNLNFIKIQNERKLYFIKYANKTHF